MIDNFHFDKSTIYCSYHGKFMNINVCNNTCHVLCKSNKKSPNNYQFDENTYKSLFLNKQNSDYENR